MKPKDIFGLVLRIFGLLGMFLIVRHWLIVWHHEGHVHRDSPAKLLIEGLIVIGGLYLVLGCPLLINFIYPEKKNSENSERET